MNNHANLDNCRKCTNYQGSRFGNNLFVCAMHPYGNENCPDFEQSQLPLFKLVDVNDSFNDFIVPIQDETCLKVIKHPENKNVKLICFKLLGLENSELLNIIRYKCDCSISRLKNGIYKGFEIRLEHCQQKCSINLEELELENVTITMGVKINNVVPLFLKVNHFPPYEGRLIYLHVVNSEELSYDDRRQQILSAINNNLLDFFPCDDLNF